MQPQHVHMLELGSLVGEYKIEKLVGQGGMGQVYGAIHPVIGKRAAIKVLRGELCADSDAIERFVLEARAVNQIGHPNIVDVFAFGALPDGRQYMVMEWLRGESLDQRIRRMLPTLDETCEIVLSICAALDAAHAEHLVHRDLKPHNVFLSHARGMKPAVKLLDFGLVKLVGDGQVERTRSGSMLGTPAYMSPEQARGRGVDHRTDLYALGVMLFELVTGTLPFIEQSAMEMVMAHIQSPPPVPSAIRHGLPPVLDRLILELLAKEPEYRPTIAQVVGVLHDVQKLALAAPQALTPTVIAGHHPRTSAPPVPMAVPEMMTMRSNPASSMPVPMLHPSTASTPPVMPIGSVPATASVVVAPASKTRWPLAVVAALGVAAIAFSVVFALRGSEAAGGPDAAIVAPVATVDAAVATTVVAPDAAEPALDAALAIELPDAAVKTVKRPPRDAGVIVRATDAAVVAPPPDAASKPVDDGDGLLPSKGNPR